MREGRALPAGDGDLDLGGRHGGVERVEIPDCRHGRVPFLITSSSSSSSPQWWKLSLVPARSAGSPAAHGALLPSTRGWRREGERRPAALMLMLMLMLLLLVV